MKVCKCCNQEIPVAFEDLNDKAKEKARQWWREQEYSDPTWYSEHLEAYRSVSEWVGNNISDDMTIDQAADIIIDNLEVFKMCKLTGYYADYECARSMINWAKSRDESVSEECIRYCLETLIQMDYEESWNQDLENRMTNDSVDDAIISNDYQFYSDGRIV